MGRHHHRRGQNNKRGDIDSVDGSSTGEERPEPLAGHEKYEKVPGTFRHVVQNSWLRSNYMDSVVPAPRTLHSLRRKEFMGHSSSTFVYSNAFKY
jgi:hypothetical protein